MKAVLLDGHGGPEVLRIGDIETPQAAEGEVLIRVETTSVNRPDILQRQGGYPPPPCASPILGLECAGTIEDAGDATHGLVRGQRVAALLAGGGYAELAVAHASHVLPIPDAMSFDEAACICEAYITAYMNLFIGARLEDGETVLLHGGGGGVGTAAVQLCRTLAQRSKLIVTCSSGKLERLARLGAHRTIDYRNEDFAEAVLRETDGRGADVILDHIGAPYLERNLKALAVGGRIALIGVMGGRKAEIDLGRLLVKCQQIIGSVLRPRPIAEKAKIIAEFNQVVMPLFVARRIVPVIDSVYPLEDVAAAHRRMEDGAHFGKIVLRCRAGDA
ncbi:MAG TPA: NAD(P)H-quinone oxidoreductase [Gammaproteobacteria bacterium]